MLLLGVSTSLHRAGQSALLIGSQGVVLPHALKGIVGLCVLGGSLTHRVTFAEVVGDGWIATHIADTGFERNIIQLFLWIANFRFSSSAITNLS